MKSDLYWWGAVGALAAVDVYCGRRGNGTTLSSAARRTFRTHHPVGRLVFVAGWTGLTYWLVPHILQPMIQELHDWTAEGPLTYDDAA